MRREIRHDKISGGGIMIALPLAGECFEFPDTFSLEMEVKHKIN